MKKILWALLLLVGAGAAAYYLFPSQTAELMLNSERSRSGLHRAELQTDGGLQWIYLDGGQGEPLILIHGFGADKDNWTRVSRWLTPQYRVIAPDLPGFGESSHPQDASYTIDAQVERLHAFVQKLGLKEVHLGGSSMGGFMAAVYAAKYPAEVKSLWLIAPGGVDTSPPSELAQLLAKGERNPLQASTLQEFRGIAKFVMTDPPFVPGVVLDTMAQRRIDNRVLEQRIFTEIRTSPGLEGRVKGLATPARVVWGEQDRALHVGGAAILVKLMPKATALVLPGIGHLPMIERPRPVAEDYLQFRSQIK